MREEKKPIEGDKMKMIRILIKQGKWDKQSSITY